MSTPILAHLADAIARIAPPALAEDWDNVGLVIGDPKWPLQPGPIVLTIDLTGPVLDEAIAAQACAIVAYHPPIFTPTKRITSADRAGTTVLECAARRIGVVSPHTALDAAPGGMCDWLLDQCAPTGSVWSDRRALRPTSITPTECKVVTFVPLAQVDRVAEAMANAGAGVIGDYTRCSYRVDGTGTFLGGASTNPAVGNRGELEHVGEMRLEMVSPARLLPEVIAALRAAHPYEEPAFDVYALSTKPNHAVGPGRIGSLVTPEPVRNLVARLARRLSVATMQLVGDPNAMIRRIAVCPGSGGSLADAAAAHGADLFVTGEMSHHAMLSSLDRGCAVALAGHTETERPYLPTLAQRIIAEGMQREVRVATRDRSPLSSVQPN